jgi:hypothetical protein
MHLETIFNVILKKLGLKKFWMGLSFSNSHCIQVCGGVVEKVGGRAEINMIHGINVIQHSKSQSKLDTAFRGRNSFGSVPYGCLS